jgi:hypothetical protein
MECEDVGWVHVAQDRDRWRGCVNRVIKNFPAPQSRRIVDQLSDYQFSKTVFTEFTDISGVGRC